MPPDGGGNGAPARSPDRTAAAVVVLYERHATRVHRVCVDRLGDRDEAADAVQDTFLKAWLALRDGVVVRHPLPWLLTIADNVCVSRFRARRARVSTTSLRDDASVELSEAVVEVASLPAALRTLPERQRQALLRRELQGYSYDEIGAELGVSRASVAALLHRARLTVANALGDARRGLGAIVPVPAVLRAPFESAMATGAAVAGTAVVAVTQLAGAGPAPLSPPPPRTSDAIAAPLHLAVAATAAGARPHASEPVSRAAPELGVARSPVAPRSGAPRDTAVGVLGATSVESAEAASAHLPDGVEDETSGVDTTAPAPETGTPPTAAPPTAGPAADDEPAVGDEPAVALPTSPSTREERAAGAPGKQPRGTKGRAEHAPGLTGNTKREENSSAAADKGGKPPEDPQPSASAERPADAVPATTGEHAGQGSVHDQDALPDDEVDDKGAAHDESGLPRGKKQA